MPLAAGLFGFIGGAAKGASVAAEEQIKSDIALKRQLSLLDVKNRFAGQETEGQIRALAQTDRGKQVLERVVPGFDPNNPEDMGTAMSLFSLMEGQFDVGAPSVQERVAEGVTEDVLRADLEDQTGLADRRAARSAEKAQAEARARQTGQFLAREDFGLPLTSEQRPTTSTITLVDRDSGGHRFRQTLRADDPRVDELLALTDETGRPLVVEGSVANVGPLDFTEPGGFNVRQTPGGDVTVGTRFGHIPIEEMSRHSAPRALAKHSGLPESVINDVERARQGLGFDTLYDPRDIPDIDVIRHSTGVGQAIRKGIAGTPFGVGEAFTELRRLFDSADERASRGEDGSVSIEDVPREALRSFGEEDVRAAIRVNNLRNEIRRFFVVARARPGVWDQTLALENMERFGIWQNPERFASGLDELRKIMSSEVRRNKARLAAGFESGMSASDMNDLRSVISESELLMSGVEGILASHVLANTTVGGKTVLDMTSEDMSQLTREDVGGLRRTQQSALLLRRSMLDAFGL